MEQDNGESRTNSELWMFGSIGEIGVIPRVTETRIDKVKLFPSRLIEQHEQSSGQEKNEQEEKKGILIRKRSCQFSI